MNESVTEVFVEQPLASPGSAKNDTLILKVIVILIIWPLLTIVTFVIFTHTDIKDSMTDRDQRAQSVTLYRFTFLLGLPKLLYDVY